MKMGVLGVEGPTGRELVKRALDLLREATPFARNPASLATTHAIPY
jgi:hypothetical protein